MRQENTDKYIEEARIKVNEVLEKEREKHEEQIGYAPDQSRFADFTQKKGFADFQQKVLEIQNDPNIPKIEKTKTAIARRLKSTRYRVELAGNF